MLNLFTGTPNTAEPERERYTILEAKAQDLVKKTGVDFADAFAQVKSKLGADSRKAKSVVSLHPEKQLANSRALMTPEERAFS